MTRAIGEGAGREMKIPIPPGIRRIVPGSQDAKENPPRQGESYLLIQPSGAAVFVGPGGPTRYVPPHEVPPVE